MINCISLSSRLKALRSSLSNLNLDGFIIQRGDEFLNEYVAPYAERLAWLTGFTGSAGMAVILSDCAAVFSDGRYILQMEQQLNQEEWSSFHISHNPPAKWIHDQKPNAKVGYDPQLMSERDIKPFIDQSIQLVPVERNPIDNLWTDQPDLPLHPIFPHPIQYSGQSNSEKIALLTQKMKAMDQYAFIFCDPASICWLLNIRGSDIPYTPIPLVFAILHANGQVFLYANEKQILPETRGYLGSHVNFHHRENLLEDLKHFRNQRIALDPVQTPLWFLQILEKVNAHIIRQTNPCLLLKSCKNETEQTGAKKAHLRDGIAMCRFLAWLEKNGIGLSEIEVAQRLNQFRQETGGDFYREESFPAISSVGSNAAIIHYQPSSQNNAILQENQIYLIDSGGQYLDGTTDITRTIWLGKTKAPQEVTDAATCVLKGHIAIDSAIFPEGTNGSRLDSFARRALWTKGLDFDHGTGHGVGSFLSVHEGPCRISSRAGDVPLQKGMILSNEPGYYCPNHFGIRLENLLLVKQAKYPKFLSFETLTLVPFDQKIIDPLALNDEEKKWLNCYHERIYKEISPYLNAFEVEWLKQACSSIT